MKIADLPCPNCGSQLNVDDTQQTATCPFCQGSFPLDDEAQHIKLENLTQAGYEFEKGRQIAKSEAGSSNNSKFIIAALAIIFLIAIGMFLVFSNQPGTPDPDNGNTSVQLTEDADLNAYLKEYNEVSHSQVIYAEKGNRSSQAFVKSYGYDIELSLENSQMTVSINQTNANANAGVAGMRNVFHDTVKVLDPSLTDDEIYNLFDSSVSNPPKERRNHKLGSIVINYFPDEKRGLDTVRGHLTLTASYPDE